MPSLRGRAAALALWLAGATGAAADPSDPDKFAYGEYLASQCAACHLGRDADAARLSGVPDIWAMEHAEFVKRFAEAKNSSENESLRLTLEALSPQDIDALFYFFKNRAR